MRIHVSIELSPESLERVQATVPDAHVVYEPVSSQLELKDRLDGSDIALANWLPDTRGTLKWIQLAAAGVDQLPAKGVLKDPALVVSSSSGLASPCIAEYVIAAILRRRHRLSRAFAIKQMRSWPADFEPLEADTLVGARVGVLGAGGIGLTLAAYLTAMGADVTVLGNSGQPAEKYLPTHVATLVAALPPVRMLPRTDIDRVFADNEVIVCALPSTPDTRHIVNADRLARMRPDSWLINVGRGSAVDEEALREALDKGRPAGATLDVTEAEPLPATSWLYEHPAVELTPHTAGYFAGYNDACAALFASNLGRYVGGLPVWNVVQSTRGY